MTVITRSIFLDNSVKTESKRVKKSFHAFLLARGDAFGTGKCGDMRCFFNQSKNQEHVMATVGRRLQR